MHVLPRLRRLLEVADHPLTPVSAVPRPGLDGLDITDLTFRTRHGEAVRALRCRPAGRAGALPAVLVLHAHGGRHDIGRHELLNGRPALHAPIGPALAAHGIQTLCVDMPTFGARAGSGPDGGEGAAAKAALWQGRSLAGQMVGESHAALSWLAGQGDVRADRIGVFGLSMGATLGYWLAAVDSRVRALAQDCCLADFATLVASGAHDRHGTYLTVPGLLSTASNGRIAGMVAPRAQFIGLGDDDPLTPPHAADTALAEVRRAYAARGGRLVIHREPGSGHVETAAMRAGMLAFFARELA